jgi:DNA polymerase (family X)
MAWVNEDVAAQFAEIAALLKLQGADRFRVRAYERAAGAIGAAPVDLSTLPPGELAAVNGIGASTAAKIVEYLDTGRIAMLEDLRAAVPPGVVELTRVPGLGPKTAVVLHDAGIDSVEALRGALDSGAVAGLKGVGARTAENLREALGRMGVKDTDRVPMADAIAIAEELVARLRRADGVVEVTYAGSLRRMRETIGDIDILAATREPGPVMAALRESDLVQRVLGTGDTKTSVILRRGIAADLRAVDPDVWGAVLVYLTGSKAHNVRMRERALRRGLSLSEYGLTSRPDMDAPPAAAPPAAAIACPTEVEVYAALGLPLIPPPVREDTGEIEAAAAGRLPSFVTLRDIRGDLHGHSDWSGDGKAPLEEMVAAAAARGYEYFAVTDHAENLTMNGLTRDDMSRRRRVIAQLQERHGMRILDGAELNIGIDGSVDYDDEFLYAFDFCVASVHTLMNRPAEQQTQRIVAAMRHPAVNVIGHPTGRKLGVRPGYGVDLDAIVEAAVATGTALEVNASPRRLDLSGDMVRRAVDAGALLAISCDAHSLGDLDSMRYGVATAQRGWATPADVLNCRPLTELLEVVNAKRERRPGTPRVEA